MHEVLWVFIIPSFLQAVMRNSGQPRWRRGEYNSLIQGGNRLERFSLVCNTHLFSLRFPVKAFNQMTDKYVSVRKFVASSSKKLKNLSKSIISVRFFCLLFSYSYSTLKHRVFGDDSGSAFFVALSGDRATIVGCVGLRIRMDKSCDETHVSNIKYLVNIAV